ncbi:MAG: acylase [Proteobacteria bacterium]|nr:acylase [Pseudomonadota bacterium]
MKRFGLWALALLVLAAGGLMVWEPLAAAPQAAPPGPARAWQVEIVRDEYGVPHINGATDADAAYGLAWAHAEDDFATLQEVLAMTRGRYGALAGADGAGADYALALLDARATAHAAYPAYPADLRRVLEAYAAGLNHYAETHRGEQRLSHLFPVSGEDVATGFVLRSPFFFSLDRVIGRLVEGKPLPPETARPMTPAGRDPESNGSNAFALAPAKMADGHTWLISNSHQPYEGGVAWYEAVVHSGEGLDMAGALFPGSPFVLLGHNRNLGWTNTVNHPDLVDVFKLELNVAGDQYKFDGQWRPLESKLVWLPVKWGPFVLPVPRRVYRSVHGPVIVNKEGAFAVRYAGMGEARMVEQYYRLQKAQDYGQWIAAMKLRGIPATNFVYADKTGRIAYFYNAMFPARKPGFDYTRIVPGNTSASLWQGAVPWEATPMLVNPASGFVVNSNNTPFMAAGPGSEMDPARYPLTLGIERHETNRIHRAIELLSPPGRITPERLLEIKFDMAYSRQGFAGPWIASILALDLSGDPRLKAAQDLLRQWDWTSDGKGRADALAEELLHTAARPAYNREPLPDPRASLAEAVGKLEAGFGRIDPPLGEVQRLVRGKVNLPADGGTDTLRAAATWEPLDHGRQRVKHGDSFIMVIDWDQAGKVTSRSVQPYGAATTRPDSPHYTDQMALFESHRFKPVHFDWNDALAHATRRYRP